MDKEEILEKSRIENQNKDVANIEISKSGLRAGWIVTVCLAALVAVLACIWDVAYTWLSAG